MHKIFNSIEITDKVRQYNEYFYFCNNHKLLRETANKLREGWIKEIEDDIDKLNESLTTLRGIKI